MHDLVCIVKIKTCFIGVSVMRLHSLGLLLLVASASLHAAPIPADNETSKPRAKLIGTLTLDQDIRQVLWSPDGTALVVQTGKNMVLVFKREQVLKNEAKPKPVAAFELPADMFVQIHDATKTLYGVSKPKHINSEALYHSWNLQPLLEGTSPTKPDRTVTLDIEKFAVATLGDDGRRLYVLTSDYKSRGTIWDRHNQQGSVSVIPHLQRFSTKTGDKIDDVWTMTEEDKSHLDLSHDMRAGQLYTSEKSGDDFTVQAFALGKEKPLWEQKLDGKASGECRVLHSGTGGLIACDYDELLERPVPQQQPQRGFAPAQQRPQMQQVQRNNLILLNAKTGETIHKLSKDDTTYATMKGFSFDGQLFLGQLSGITGTALNVWHTATGKVVKSWSGEFSSYRSQDNEQHIEFAFSPNAQELATLCVLTKNIEGPKTFTPPIHHGSTNWTQTPNILRTEYTATIGLWDFSTLVK
jgi:WD40 repeat protein